MSYFIEKIYKDDKAALAQIDELLRAEGIIRDANLDYICAMYDDDYRIVGTGSCFGSTLRCFAVKEEYQGEGLLNRIVTHLIEYQYQRGNIHLFLYTKISAAKFFKSLGFYEIARVDNSLIFMENRADGFQKYLKKLQDAAHTHSQSAGRRNAAIVMNANPFTLGHLYLAETAAANCDLLHIFILSEDVSLVPFSVRKKLVTEGVAHIKNIVCHDSGPYIISNVTFPSYFLKDERAVIENHAYLDLAVFAKIAASLNISERFVGEEPASQVTSIYNDIMLKELPALGIACNIVSRKEALGQPISAGTVRRALQEKDFDKLKLLVPPSTYNYFISETAAPVIAAITAADNVIHY